MSKQNLFNLIRNGDVVLWAGAGLSIYAGYPAGADLKRILLESLSDEERATINHDLLLPDLVDSYYEIKALSKNPLLQLLRREYLKPEISRRDHDKIKSIPHFRTIITTNYDMLFENAYGVDLSVILSYKHIAYLENKKIHLFKIHGDLSDPDSIVIARSEYERFLDESLIDKLYWSKVRDLVATKNILFLGYSLEDPNVESVFNEVSKILGNHRKECFFVAPDQSIAKINMLKEKKIHYINATAETLIDELITDIKDNIINDFETKKINSEILREFLTNYGLSAELKSIKDAYKLVSIGGFEKELDGKIIFKIKDEISLIERLKEFTEGKKFGDFEISGQSFDDFKLTAEGINLLRSSTGEISLKFTSTPKISSKVDIRFANGFELTEIPVEIFGSQHLIQIRGNYKKLNFKIEMDPKNMSQFKFNFDHDEIYTKTKDEIEIFTFLKYLFSGSDFKVHAHQGKIFSQKIPPNNQFLTEVEFFLKYFMDIKVIEDFFKIRFLDIHVTKIDGESIALINKILRVINNEKIDYVSEGELSSELVDSSEEKLDQIKKIHDNDASLEIHLPNEEIVELHEQKINLGYKVIELHNPYILNLENVINGIESQVRIKSRVKRETVSYRSEYKTS